MKLKFTIILGLTLCLVGNSCKKVDPVIEKNLSATNDVKTDFGLAAAPVPAYPLDWENIPFMPTPAGANTIQVPWASGASTQITDEVLIDYKKKDGWVLLYNTFSSSVQSDELYFILYNKYRGLMKMYYYIPPTANFIESANIVHNLEIDGSYANTLASPIMNFAASTRVNYNNNQKSASILEHAQVARSTWYAFEYELAYDQNIANQNFEKFKFFWPVKSNSVTKFNVNGKIGGTVTGSMATSATNLTVSPSFSSSSTGDGNIIIKGESDVEKVKPSITTQLFNTLKGLVTKNLTSGIGGIVSNLFSGIFGGKDGSSADNVNLKINANIEMEGTLTGNFLITSKSISIPGYDQSNTTGFIPAYNEPLGVFYISNKPKIKETVTSTADGIAYLVRQTYSIVDNSYNLVFNPAVTSIANISNITEEVILSGIPAGINEIYGQQEIINDITYYTSFSHSAPWFSSIQPRPRPLAVGSVAIRVKFDVVPKDGSKKSVIVKTFIADLVK